MKNKLENKPKIKTFERYLTKILFSLNQGEYLPKKLQYIYDNQKHVRIFWCINYKKIISLQILIFAYKTINNLLSEQLNENLITTKDVHN